MSSHRIPPVLTAALAGCMPHVAVDVLQPALVTVPADIRTLAVVDRSAPGSAGEHVLGVLEGAVTGEALLGDREGAHAALAQLHGTLSGSPRFAIVLPHANGEQVETDIFDETISWAAARRLCEQSGAEALVALEAFDSDSSVSVTVEDREETTDDGKTRHVKVHIAERDTSVLTAWRVYYPAEKRILDDTRDRRFADSWTAEGESEEAAIAALPSQVDSIVALGRDAGDDYARRIAPTYVQVSRAYYGRGDERFTDARRHVRARQWEAAGRIWRGVAEQESDAKLRGRAAFNLALWFETRGDLDGALAWAEKAHGDLGNARARQYIATLHGRIADRERLAVQMAAPPEASPPPDESKERPAAVPAAPVEQKERPR